MDVSCPKIITPVCNLYVYWTLFLVVEPFPALPDLLPLQVDVVFPQVTAGSGDLPATGSWFDFFQSRVFSLEMKFAGPVK